MLIDLAKMAKIHKFGLANSLLGSPMATWLTLTGNLPTRTYRFDLHSNVLRYAGHTIGPFFFALPMNRPATNSFDNMASSSLVISRAIAVLECAPECACVSEKMRMLPFSLLIANCPFGRHGP